MILDKYILTDIENAVANGHDTIERIAKAIDVNYETFKNWYYEKTKEAKKTQYATLIKESISKGRSKSRPELIKASEDGILYKLKARETKETITEQWTELDRKTGKMIVVKEHKVIKKKMLEPDTTLLIFTSVNQSERWDSINNAVTINTNDDDTIKDALKLLGYKESSKA